MTPEQRQQLIDRRRADYQGYDFAQALCCACGNDTVAEYGERYVTANITGCNKCHRSWCD
jgi:hypothetical protein